MRRHVWAVLAASLVVATSACASRADDGALRPSDPTTTEAGGTTSVPPSSSDTTTDECRPDDRDPAALEALMVDDQEGFVLEADSVGDTGPSDLAKAITDDEQDDSAEVMKELGFRRGYQRYWTSTAGGGLVVFVYEFCDGVSALTYGARVFDFVGDLEPFEVVGATGARGISGVRDKAIVAYASGVADATLVLTVASGPDGTLPVGEVRDRATALLIEQLAALEP